MSPYEILSSAIEAFLNTSGNQKTYFSISTSIIVNCPETFMSLISDDLMSKHNVLNIAVGEFEPGKIKIKEIKTPYGYTITLIPDNSQFKISLAKEPQPPQHV